MKNVSNVALAFVLLIAAARSAAADAPKAAAAAPKIDWATMTFDQKRKYMKTTVLPEMKKLFISYDAKEFKNMNCVTCHGDGVEDGKFKMPNARLPKLPKPTAQSDFLVLQKKKPEAVNFMSAVVKPKMAELLGLPEWSPTVKTGFGCYRCHTKEGE